MKCGGGFSSLARILAECLTIHSLPVQFKKKKKKLKWRLTHANFTLYARISPQWLSDLRLWPNAPYKLRELVSG